MKYRCIIFDCDGVLVDSEPIAHEVIVELANQYGADIDYDYAHHRFSGGFLQQAIDHIQSLIPVELPSNFEQEYRRITFERFAKDITAIKGIRDFLLSLEIPYCVASNGPKNKMDITLGATGLLPLFQNKLYSAYDLNAWKPNPKLFLHAAQEMGYLPSECLVIEDSASGVQAAVAGGFDVYALANKKNRKELKQLGAKVFNSIEEIQQTLLG